MFTIYRKLPSGQIREQYAPSRAQADRIAVYWQDDGYSSWVKVPDYLVGEETSC